MCKSKGRWREPVPVCGINFEEVLWLTIDY